MEYKRWETPLSNCGSLGFKRLVDQGSLLLFEITDEHDALYEVVLKRGNAEYSYMIRNESYTTHGVDLIKTGWSYIVEGGSFAGLMTVMIEEAEWRGWDPFVHYVVSTDDSCLELLSTSPPIVRKI